MEKLTDLQARALGQLESIWNNEQLEAWRVEYLGRKGAVSTLFEQIGSLPPQERGAFGKNANAVKQALIRKFQSLQPNQFTTVGKGWDVPADVSDPNNNAKNRRVEIKVYPIEAK